MCESQGLLSSSYVVNLMISSRFCSSTLKNQEITNLKLNKAGKIYNWYLKNMRRIPGAINLMN